MKKYLLSSAVIISFLFYSFTTRKTQDPPATSNILNIPSSSVSYKDGTYTGDTADAYYGNIKVAAVIQKGKLTKVNILEYPNDRERSIAINTHALPILQSEATQSQNASVDIVSGATDTSRAFIESLGSALVKAGN